MPVRDFVMDLKNGKNFGKVFFLCLQNSIIKTFISLFKNPTFFFPYISKDHTPKTFFLRKERSSLSTVPN